ncbi:GNAT family N-acetyltransferase, partial [Aneurinibacillus aneurinilyticus]|nr:GNAT family N-acetyltransferase [Aneurinibacillus aneurinilyticus]
FLFGQSTGVNYAKRRKSLMEEIIPVTADNLEQCITLYSRVFNSEPWNENWTHEAARSRLSDLLHTPKSLIFALFSHQRLVGFIGGNCKETDKGTTFYLAELCIDNQAQGNGYGSRLLSHLENELKKQNVQSIYLLTMDDSQAKAFYNKNSYVINDKRIVMRKHL